MKRAFKSISPHSPGDNWIGTNNKHSMRLLRGLKRQQWYEDWLLPVLREKKTCFRHQRLKHRPAGPRAAAIGVCRRGLLRSISACFPHLSPKSLCPRFQVRAMGCHWEKRVIRNRKTCPCPQCSRAVAGKVEG